MRAVVKGTGMYVPPHVVDNHARKMPDDDDVVRNAE